MVNSPAGKMLHDLTSGTVNKVLLAIIVSSVLIAALSPILLSSPQCTTEITQQERDATGCIIGADFGPGFGIIFGLASAIAAITLRLILQLAGFKKLSFLAKFFLLIPILLPFLFFLWTLLGLVGYIFQK